MNRREDAAIEELAQLLDGELTADEANAPVRELALLASSVTETEAVARPTPAFRAALRNQLVADVEAAEVGALAKVKDAVWHRTARWRHSARIAVASATASSLIGTAGVAVAAQHALPGEMLYSLKRTTESVRLVFAGDLPGEGQMHLAFAEERLEELERGVPDLSTDEVVDTLDAMDESSVRGANALLRAVEEGAGTRILDGLSAFSASQRQRLSDLYADLPPGAQPFADDSLEVLRRIDTQVEIAMDPTCSQCESDPEVAVAAPAPADRPDPVTRPGDGPAVPDRPRCDCVAREEPAPPRDPGLLPSDTNDEPEPEPEPQPQPDPEPGDQDERVIVPPLPGPIDPVGEQLDQLIEELLELGRPVTPDPSELPDLPDPPATGKPETEIPDPPPPTVGELLEPGS